MNTTEKGDALENKIYEYFATQIAEDCLPWKKDFCKVFPKKAYYSRDRERDIVFDVSIEFYLPGATEYSFVWLIECKNYSTSVPVDDVEEFYTKVRQVAPANGKAIVASMSAFQIGGVNFARNKKMGLFRYFDAANIKWELLRSPAACAPFSKDTDFEMVLAGLTLEEFHNDNFDLYMLSYSGPTNSLWDFTDSMLSDFVLTNPQSGAMRNPKGRPSRMVPYIDLDEIEEKSFRLLKNTGYKGGPAPLDEVCYREATRTGLQVTINALPESEREKSALGKISFSPLEIKIYQQSAPNIGRDRFTLAHELAHYLLSHGNYMSSESCDERDFRLLPDQTALVPDIIRMEYQANIYASCLLLPKSYFISDFRIITKWLQIANRGFGELFLDDQACNYQNYEKVTYELMKRYSVSRSAVRIRLESLGLLCDTRTQSQKFDALPFKAARSYTL